MVVTVIVVLLDVVTMLEDDGMVSSSAAVSGGIGTRMVVFVATVDEPVVRPWIEVVTNVVDGATTFDGGVETSDEVETSLRTAATVSTSMATTSGEPLDPHAVRPATAISQCHFT